MQIQSNGATTWVYIPNRPRSQSLGSSLVGRCNGARALGSTSSVPSSDPGCCFPDDESVYKRSNSGSTNTSRYKTELCRPYQEYGYCKYGDKCQFAHGGHELRAMPRHPKYKTELCRTFHTNGFCPYGPRCHFIHNHEEARRALEKLGKSGGTLPLSSHIPISPVDSGISSPDDRYGGSNSRVFDFASESSTGSSDEDWNSDQLSGIPWVGEDCLDGYLSRDQVLSPDTFVDVDVSPSSSNSPLKLGQTAESGLYDLFANFSLKETTPVVHRLPVFDYISLCKGQDQ